MDGTKANLEITGFQILITEGDNNHSPQQWGEAIAKMIFNVEALTGERLATAQYVQRLIAEAIAKQVERLIASGQSEVSGFVDSLFDDIHDMSKGSAWGSVLRNAEWTVNAMDEVSHHFRSIVHLESLLSADRQKAAGSN